ncbi:MAG: MMPL family transporter [Gammaproteobacteria bacterium]|nr:MAG: MMPL family transporter [Gammaproteobacteria bacterium]
MSDIPGNNPDRRERLDRETSPVAILRGGVYVYANPAYLKLFGHRDFSDIRGKPVLNTVKTRARDRFTKHIEEAEGTSSDTPALPPARLSLVRQDGSRHHLKATFQTCMLDDKSCVEMWLSAEQEKVSGKARPAIRWRYYLSLAFLVLFSLLPPALLPGLDIDNAPKVYFPDDEPAVILDEKLRTQFPNDQVYILLFEGLALFSDDVLNAYHKLARTLEKNPLVDKVYGLTTQDHIAGSEDGFLVEPVINIRELSKTTPAERLQKAVADRFAKNALVSYDGSAISMIVAPIALNNSLQRLELEHDVLAAVEEARLSGYLTARTGPIPLDIAELRSMLRDNMIFIPATVVIGLFLIWWLFRRWLAVILAGISIGVVVNSTIALYVLAGQPFTLISSMVPPLLSALTIAALVHLYNALHHAAQRGVSGQARMQHALGEIRRPALFTALTTAAGMLSLATSPIPAIRTFGLVSAAGVMLIYLVVVIILPPIISVWDKATWPKTGGGLHWMDLVVRPLYRTGIRYPVWVIGLTVIVLGAGAPALWNVKVETSLQEFFAPDHPIRRDTAYFESIMAGTGNLDVIFETPERDGLKKPEYLAFIRSFQSWAEKLPEVDKTASAADFIEEMHWGFNAEDPAFRTIPDDPKLISQYLFIYDGDDLFDFVDPEFRLSRVSMSINVHPANEIAALMDNLRGYLNEHAPPGLQWEIAGNSRLFADMEELLVKGQVYSLWGALIMIFLLMLLLWRSFGSALLCMIPNISPILLIFIAMGLFGIWLDMATAMIASIAVGIAVDDTIHVYHGYISRVNAGVRPVQALARTYNQAGRAVVTTTIILSAQFMILISSSFQPTTHFGLLTSIGLWAALVFDLLLLPAIIILVATRKTGFSRHASA